MKHDMIWVCKIVAVLVGLFYLSGCGDEYVDACGQIEVSIDAIQSKIIRSDVDVGHEMRGVADKVSSVSNVVFRQRCLARFKERFLAVEVDASSLERIELTSRRYFDAYVNIMGLCWKCGESSEKIWDFDLLFFERWKSIMSTCEKMEADSGIVLPKEGIIGMPASFAMAEQFRNLVLTVLRIKDFDRFVNGLKTEQERETWRGRLNAITNCPQYIKRFDHQRFQQEIFNAMRKKGYKVISPKKSSE